MTTHILAITYPPKIEGVRNGAIRNSWRILNPDNPRNPGDVVMTHGWSGKPYRSPWNWRRSDIIQQVMLCDVFAGYVRERAIDSIGKFDIYRPSKLKIETYDKHFDLPIGEYDFSWNSCAMYAEARNDGIEPPTGEALRTVLESYHGKFTDKPVQMQVIRW